MVGEKTAQKTENSTEKEGDVSGSPLSVLQRDSIKEDKKSLVLETLETVLSIKLGIINGKLESKECYYTKEQQEFRGQQAPRYEAWIKLDGKLLLDIEEYGETENPPFGKIPPTYVAMLCPSDIPAFNHLYDIFPTKKRKAAEKLLTETNVAIANTIVKGCDERVIAKEVFKEKAIERVPSSH
ncbi:MAG: hypothetical protein ABSD68_03330 [Candidatus Micrarchaeales archaeon]|jgi:hypothetical protein